MMGEELSVEESRRVGVAEGEAPAHATQYYAALAATMGALALGCVIGYSSPAGPYLLAHTTATPQLLTNLTDDSQTQVRERLQLNQEEYNWFSSSPNLGAVCGGLLGGPAINSVGRRATMMTSAVIFVCGWLMIAFTNNLGVLVCGRVVTGVSMGLTSTAAPPYIGELASPDIRGTLGGGFQVMLTTGILFTFVVGEVVSSWRWLAAWCVVPPTLYFILVFFAKESPTFLVAKGRHKEAAESLQYFRGQHYNIQPELDMMRKTQDEAKETKASLKDFGASNILKPLIISLALMVFQQFSGVPAVIFNMSTVFKESGSGLSEGVSAVVVGVVQVVATGSATLLMDRAGRRTLLLLSASLMTVSIVSLGIYFYVREAGATMGWLPLISLIVFITAFSLGFGPVPWVMMGEVFPGGVREVTACLAAAINWTSAFIITLIFLPIRNTLGDYGVYWLFGVVNLCALLFTFLVVPETKGKTLQEITAYFRNSSNSTRFFVRNLDNRRTREVTPAPVWPGADCRRA
ncbi:facilitated trehalose transporter Tret1-like isoform X2 [Homarus americanus]|uniref:Facilitated trehalose transporter Tret1-like 7 n=4 Tax=Homarus americanus TaxID=6706 RepID=A0A8J5MXW6_HOMAM|nr:facilitated trehalose transporter Tret1-like isoform X2 [Homarus americanus]KAG7167452.1 Facilitated trehalose transporter Tret1-like 7 [Homarus americanus]